MQHTFSLFRRLYDRLPPLFPNEKKEKLKQAVERFEGQLPKVLTEIEEVFLPFGYDLWPWNEAYREFESKWENHLGEQFFLANLSAPAQERYFEFKNYGGSLGELHSGRPAGFFDSDKRAEIMPALVEMKKKVREYAHRELVGLSKQTYLRRVEELEMITEEIKNLVVRMRELARLEEEHQNLAQEIEARSRAIEYGLCHLGPPVRLQDVKESVDFFHGRKHDLNRMRGIHKPVNFVGYE